jgi:hypothetical protein
MQQELRSTKRQHLSSQSQSHSQSDFTADSQSVGQYVLVSWTFDQILLFTVKVKIKAIFVTGRRGLNGYEMSRIALNLDRW